MVTKIKIDLQELLAKTPILILENEAGVIVSRRNGTRTAALLEIEDVAAPTRPDPFVPDNRV